MSKINERVEILIPSIEYKITTTEGKNFYLTFLHKINDGSVLDNSLWIDSSDSYALKLKNNSGSSAGVSGGSFSDSQAYVNMINMFVDGGVSISGQENYSQRTYTNEWESGTDCLIRNFNSTSEKFLPCLVFDDFTAGENNLDLTNRWSTTATGGGYSVNIRTNENLATAKSDQATASCSAIADGGTSGTALDMKTLAGNSELYMRVYLANNSYGPSTFYISNADKGTKVTIDSNTATTNEYNLIFDKSLNQVRVWKDDVEMGSSPFNISGLSQWIPYLYCQNNSGGFGRGGQFACYGLGYIDGTSGTAHMYNVDLTLDSTSTKGVTKFTSSKSDEVDFTLGMSADGGSNYSEVTNKEIGAIANSGSTGKFRISHALETTISVGTPKLIPWGTKFGAYWNI